MKVAVVGGTGDFGLALAQRLVDAGEDVVIGSRDAERAREKAAEVGASGAANEDAVRGVDLVVLATKAEAALATAASLADAIGATPVLSVASELRFTKQGVLPTEDARSIAERRGELVRAPVVGGAALARRRVAREPARRTATRSSAGTIPTRRSSRSSSRRRSSPAARSTPARSRAHARSRG